jgi:hypothetical protein
MAKKKTVAQGKKHKQAERQLASKGGNKWKTTEKLPALHNNEFQLSAHGPKELILTKECAECFAQGQLYVNVDSRPYGIREFSVLDDDAAAVLAQTKRPLWLTGLSRLSDASAQYLESHADTLILGITELPESVAARLAKHAGGWISLKNVKELSPGAAGHLSKYNGVLNLEGIASISGEVAACLSGKASGRLLLGGNSSQPIEFLDNAAIELDKSLIAEFFCKETEKSVRRAVEKLAGPRSLQREQRSRIGTLFKTNDPTALVQAVRELAGEASTTADLLAELSRTRLTQCLRTWDPEMWQALSVVVASNSNLFARLYRVANALLNQLPAKEHHKARLLMAQLLEMRSPPTQKLLASVVQSMAIKDRESFRLCYRDTPLKLTRLPAEMATFLAKYPDSLHLRLDELDAESARSLAEYRGYELDIQGLRELSPEACDALSACSSAWLSLNSLTSLSEANACSLSRFKRNLQLNGLAELSDAAASALARFSGKVLRLEGLIELSDSAGHVALAMMLANHEALGLGSLRRIGKKAAAALERSVAGGLVLRRIEKNA